MEGNNIHKEQSILKIESNPCIFSAYFIDAFIVLMGFWLTFAVFVQYTWWSIPLSLIILLVSLGLGKSLFLREIILYKDKIVFKWHFFKDKTLFLNKIKKIRSITSVWNCWKFTLLTRQPFDYNSIWVIVNESIVGSDSYEQLKTKIKNLIGEK